MNNKKYLNEYYNTMRANNILKFTLFALVFVIFIEGFFVIRSMNTQRTVIVPCVEGKYVVSDKTANKTYLKRMGFYLTQLMENFTPKTVEKNYDEFLNFLSAKSFGSVQAKIMAIASDYVTTDTSSWFIPSIYKISKDKLIVIGIRRLVVGNKVMKSQRLKIVIGYKIVNGKLEVTSYDEDKNGYN